MTTDPHAPALPGHIRHVGYVYRVTVVEDGADSEYHCIRDDATPADLRAIADDIECRAGKADTPAAAAALRECRVEIEGRAQPAAGAVGEAEAVAQALVNVSGSVADLIRKRDAAIRERDAAQVALEGAKRERDAYQRDLIDIANGCGVGHPDIEESKRRIIARLRATQPAAVGVSEAMVEAALREWWAGSGDNDQTNREDMRRALEAALQAGAGVGWIACSERMPALDETALIIRHGHVRTARWNNYSGMRWWIDGCSPEFTENGVVTHWQPLPAPPAVGGE